MTDVLNRFSSDGWKLNNLKASKFISQNETKLNYEDVKKLFLSNDIKSFAEPWIDISHKTEIDCNGVVQINKIRNIAAPEVDQDNKSNPPLYKYIVTDGGLSYQLLDLRPSLVFRHNAELGGKVYIKGKIPIRSGLLILDNKNVEVKYLGGKLHDLIKSESLGQDTKNRRITNRDDGPPKFLPFGQKLDLNLQDIRKFKAMNVSDKIEKSEDSEFGTKREEEIRKIKENKPNTAQTNEQQSARDLLNKFHSGGTSTFLKNTLEKQDLTDSHLAELMKYGFRFDEAKRALDNANNNLSQALETLRAKQMKTQINSADPESRRGRQNRNKGKNKNSEDLDEDDPWFDPARYAEQMGLASRPNGTLSLADIIPVSINNQFREQSQINKTSQIYRGYQCQAQVMDGSYQEAVVVDILPNKCVRIEYTSNRERMDVTCELLRTVTGDKILEHMIPNLQSRPSPQHQNNYGGGDQYRGGGNQYGGGRGRGGFRHPRSGGRGGGRRGGGGGGGRRGGYY